MCLRCPVCGYVSSCTNSYLGAEKWPAWCDEMKDHQWSVFAAVHSITDGIQCENFLLYDSKERLP